MKAFFTEDDPRGINLYVFLSSMFVTMLVLTNMVGTKLFVFLGDTLPDGLFGTPFVLTSGIITYPVTFLVTDVVSELWGKQKADRMVLYGFIASLLMLAVLSIVTALPPAPVWQVPEEFAGAFAQTYQIESESGVKADSRAAQTAFQFTFDAPGLLLFASMTAYLFAQLLDNYLFHFWKRLTKGKHLWLRNNGSTLFSQLADTIIVNGIFLTFYWKMPWFQEAGAAEQTVTVIQVILTTYVVKLSIALIDTPLVYAAVFAIKRWYRLEEDNH